MNFWLKFLNLWRPVVEVLVLAVGIYYVVSFVRRTRGWPVLLGYAVLLALLVLTTILDLPVLTWLLQAFFAISAFAILIIFQPELRRLLAELGNLPMFNSAREQRENIEVIIESVERLADVRIGALIALEQSMNLREAVEAGITVDCEATPEMLETIFFPNNAVHDGGVIIQGDRIAFAACIFPLTQRLDLSKSLGTRHRAAIGLSEETDAVVVVVSEETGALSCAYKGELQRHLSVEELRAILTALLVKRSKPRSTRELLRTWAIEHGVLKQEPAASAPAKPEGQ